MDANHLPLATPVTGIDPHIVGARNHGLRVFGHDSGTDAIRISAYEWFIDEQNLDPRDNFASNVIRSTDDRHHAIVIGGAAHGRNNPDYHRPSQKALGERLGMKSIYFQVVPDAPPRWLPNFIAGSWRESRAGGIGASEGYANDHCHITIATDHPMADYTVTVNDASCLSKPMTQEAATKAQEAMANAAARAKEVGACGAHAVLSRDDHSLLTYKEVAPFLQKLINTPVAKAGAQK